MITRAKNTDVFIYGNVHADTSVQYSQYTLSGVCLSLLCAVMSHAFSEICLCAFLNLCQETCYVDAVLLRLPFHLAGLAWEKVRN